MDRTDIETGKAAYESPGLVTVGTFETLTQGAESGSQLDSTYPVGTPFDELTFS